MDPYVISPDIFGNDLIFVHNDDLWIMGLKERKARRLTSGLGVINNARFSPDGRSIAFRVMYGEDASYADIYTIKREGGKVKRITYLAGRSTSRRMFTDVAGWSKSGNPIVSTDAFSPFSSLTYLFETDGETGLMAPLNLGPASHILFHGSTIILGRNTNDMLHWKGYKGGTRGIIWAGNHKDGFKKIIDLNGMVSSPTLCQNRLFFVSDHEGWGQIYSSDLEGKNLKRVTKFANYYPRHLSSDGKNIVFTMAGDLHILYPGDGRIEKITPELDYSTSSSLPRFPDPGKYLEDFSLSPTCEEVSVTIRGESFLSGLDGDPILKIPPEYFRVRLLTFVSNTLVAFVSDRDNTESLYLYDLKTKKSDKFSGIENVESVTPSPDGKLIAITNNSFELHIVSTSDLKAKKIDSNELGRISDVTWSSDSKLLAYSYPTGKEFLGGHENSCIKIASVNNGKTFKVTSDDMHDFSPSFSPDGNFLYYLSNRSLDPVWDQAFFSYGFPNSIKPFFIPLKRGIVNPYTVIPDGLGKSEVTETDLDKIRTMSESIPVDAANYDSLVALNGGIILHRFEVEGGLKYLTSTDAMKYGRIDFYDFSKKSMKTVAEKAVSFAVSSNKNAILYRTNSNTLLHVGIEQKDKEIKFREQREIHVKRFKAKVIPEREWRQMFYEAWRLACENHWNPEFVRKRGKDILSKYEILLDRVTTRFELSDIIREMQGEFGTSHSYEMGGDLTSVKAVPVGKLGADLSFTKKGYRIDRIISGDLSNNNEKSPLIAANSFIEEGDFLVSIDSVKLDETHSPYSELLNRSEDLIPMEFQKKDGRRFTALVKPIGDERYLRYRSWVEQNRAYVHEKTGGRVGYVHIPDMGLLGYAEFFRLYLTESSYDGLIIDIRFNGGGHVSQLLLEKVARNRLGYDKPRRGRLGSYPGNSVNGPRIAITNEYAGSDGDIFGHAFKMMGIGPLVGTRSWGGVVGINPRRRMVDGTILTQPEFALWFRDVGFGIENHGAEPTDPVEFPPDAYFRNEDPQLDYAIGKIMKMIDADPRRLVFNELKKQEKKGIKSRRNRGA